MRKRSIALRKLERIHHHDVVDSAIAMAEQNERHNNTAKTTVLRDDEVDQDLYSADVVMTRRRNSWDT